VVVVVVVSLSLTGCIADPPPTIWDAQAYYDGKALVRWGGPVNWYPGVPLPIAYVVTPWVGSVAQTPIRFDVPNTDALITGLTNGVTYTFTVHAINTHGDDSAESEMSNPVTPTAAPVSWTIQTTPTCASLHGDSVNGGSQDVRIEVQAQFGFDLVQFDPVHVGPGQPYVLDLSYPAWGGEPEFWPNAVSVDELGTGIPVGGGGNLQANC
jgi:hypothetical protein